MTMSAGQRLSSDGRMTIVVFDLSRLSRELPCDLPGSCAQARHNRLVHGD
jgi:hypothetical protein